MSQANDIVISISASMKVYIIKSVAVQQAAAIISDGKRYVQWYWLMSHYAENVLSMGLLRLLLMFIILMAMWQIWIGAILSHCAMNVIAERLQPKMDDGDRGYKSLDS